MNRRNFMKTVALAVGVSPMALAGEPEMVDIIEVCVKEDTTLSYGWYLLTDDELIPCEPPCHSKKIDRFPNYNKKGTGDPKDPEFLRKFRKALDNTKFKKPLTVTKL